MHRAIVFTEKVTNLNRELVSEATCQQIKEMIASQQS
jgi:hypothetical protein